MQSTIEEFKDIPQNVTAHSRHTDIFKTGQLYWKEKKREKERERKKKEKGSAYKTQYTISTSTV